MPRNLIEPFALGGSIPMIELQSVVLPMPLRPITATASVPIENATLLERLRGAVVGVEVLDLEQQLAHALSSSPSWKRLPR